MENKKQLIQEIEKKRDEITVLDSAGYDYRDKINKLETENKELKNNTVRLLSQANERADLIRAILNIISGEANPISKYEVIEDMFRLQLNEAKKQKNYQSYPRVNISFLSDAVYEGGML